MRASYCYLPVLPARSGAFRAVAALSPDAVSRITPMFDVPAPALKNGKTIDSYLIERAEGIHGCWGREKPAYVDVHDLDPTLRTTTGVQPIAFLLDQLKQKGSRAIPVTGTAADRGADYLDTIKALLAPYPEGVCVRLDRDELSDPRQLPQSLNALLAAISAEPANTDLLFDYRFVGRETPEAIRASALEALNAISGIGQFRNILLAGTSIPDRLGKYDVGKVRRETRVELEAWSQLLSALGSRIPVALSDCGSRLDAWIASCSDRAAVNAALELGLEDRFVSPEAMARGAGARPALRHHFTDGWLSGVRTEYKLEKGLE